jgi:hypothetical protein
MNARSFLLAIATVATLPMSAHAQFIISKADLDAKNLQICQGLQKSIGSASQIALSFKTAGNAQSTDMYEQLQKNLTVYFQSLACEQRLQVEADASTAKSASCQRIRTSLQELADKQESLGADDKGNEPIENQRVNLRAQWAKLRCK